MAGVFDSFAAELARPRLRSGASYVELSVTSLGAAACRQLLAKVPACVRGACASPPSLMTLWPAKSSRRAVGVATVELRAELAELALVCLLCRTRQHQRHTHHLSHAYWATPHLSSTVKLAYPPASTFAETGRVLSSMLA